MSPAGGYSFRQQRLEAGPDTNRIAPIAIRRMPGQFVPSPKNRTPRRGGSRVSRTGREGSPPNSSARHVHDSAENEQRAKPNQEHSGLLNLSLSCGGAVRLYRIHRLKLAIVDAKGTIRAQAKPTTKPKPCAQANTAPTEVA